MLTITEAFLTKCQWWLSLVHHQIAKQKVCKESCSIWRLYCVHLLKCTHSLLQTCWHLFYVSLNYWWRLMNQIDSSQKRAAHAVWELFCVHSLKSNQNKINNNYHEESIAKVMVTPHYTGRVNNAMRNETWRLRSLHIWLVWSTMAQWMKWQRLLIL